MLNWIKSLFRKIELSRFKIIRTYRGYMVIEKLFFINRVYTTVFNTKQEADEWIEKWGNAW